MNELDLQRLVITSARSAGGFGFKLSNKFLIGIPDLLIQLPGQSTGIWEVKLSKKPKSVEEVTLKLTPLQEKTLSEFDKAGGFCGVISFLSSTGETWMDAFLYRTLAYEDQWIRKHRVSILNHVRLPRGHREETIVEVMNRMWSYYGAK